MDEDFAQVEVAAFTDARKLGIINPADDDVVAAL